MSSNLIMVSVAESVDRGPRCGCDESDRSDKTRSVALVASVARFRVTDGGWLVGGACS